MSTLLVDIGNTRVKWARLEDGRLGRASLAAHSSWGVKEFERRVVASVGRLDRIVVATVGPARLNRALAAAARLCGAPPPETVATRPSACGVTIGYIDPWRLGVDRFLAIIGAHRRFTHRPVCVVSIGTAITIDLVGVDGRHWGGAIVPGPSLMMASLLDGTSGIRRRTRGGSGGRKNALFARSTRVAVEQGARYAAAAAVDRAAIEARSLVGRAPLVVLTGGGAESIEPLIRCAYVSAPDLVLLGLAAWTLATAHSTN